MRDRLFYLNVGARGFTLELIVCTPDDAFRCFMGNELDLLVVGNCVLRKEEQDPALKVDYSLAFEAD
ncbi:MAG: hypothetical protein Q7T45_23270 [Bradyrhizobium sp.]|uniref:hypothetical protein n=1 Tax=Bradyrhizobium sp. TaxID=376 RepID=UPI00271C67D6|nr:hypothetical protein [Bradyrhizobium sp.]MDO8400739.1 hypothetical protein [Bradyrhizobium sp.]